MTKPTIATATHMLIGTLWGVVQSYAVVVTGSVWVAAFLHSMVNSVYAFSVTLLAEPKNAIWSFGLGVYGLLCLAPIAVLLLRAPVWAAEAG